MTLREELIEMAKKEIEGMARKEAIYWLNNDAIPSSGSVTALMYYRDTEPFACRHHDEIVEIMEESDMKLMTLNDMAWFAWEYYILGQGEEIIDELMGIEEDDED